MSEPTLEQVKGLAEQLSPKERLQLWKHIADLSDSGIESFDAPSLILDDKTLEASEDRAVLVSTDTFAAIILKGRLIFQVLFYPENYQQSRMEIHSWRNEPPPESVKEQIREILSLHGTKEVTDEEISAACQDSASLVFEAETYRLSREMSVRLGNMAWILFECGMKIIELSVHNDIARQTGYPTKTLDEIVKILEPCWKHIKEHLNLTPGGRRNVKHTWTVRDYTCLSVYYDRLKPIWREAKKIAKAAQMSKERTRQQRWKEEVMTIYQEQDLPADLIDLLAIPQATPPADLALAHAARICIPDAAYSLKVLKAKLKHFNPAARTSPDNGENRGTSFTL